MNESEKREHDAMATDPPAVLRERGRIVQWLRDEGEMFRSYRNTTTDPMCAAKLGARALLVCELAGKIERGYHWR